MTHQTRDDIVTADSATESRNINPVDSRFGKRLKILRQQRNLDEIDFASRLFISVSHLRELENGSVSVTLKELDFLAKALRISIPLLLEHV